MKESGLTLAHMSQRLEPPTSGPCQSWLEVKIEDSCALKHMLTDPQGKVDALDFRYKCPSRGKERGFFCLIGNFASSLSFPDLIAYISLPFHLVFLTSKIRIQQSFRFGKKRKKS